MKATVIIATYNYARALELCLVGLERQSCTDFDVVIADDGSGPEVAEVIGRARERGRLSIRHVWQEDRGIRKARIVNMAVGETDANLLLFLDNDALPARDWFELHRDAYRSMRLVPGGHVRLTREQSESLDEDAVRSGAFEALVSARRRRQLLWMHVKNSYYLLIRNRQRPRLFGMNFSAARDLFERVNGYDALYEGYSKEDSDLRTRMRYAGASARCLWHRSIVYHMWHEPLIRGEPTLRNCARYAQVKRRKLPWRCEVGLQECLAEDRVTRG